MTKMLLLLALLGYAALAQEVPLEDSSAMIQVHHALTGSGSGSGDDAGLPENLRQVESVRVDIPTFKELKNIAKIKLENHRDPEGAAKRSQERQAKDEMDSFDNRRAINAKVMENNRKQAEALQAVYAQQSPAQGKYFKEQQDKIDKLVTDKFKASITNEQIEKMQETTDKLQQVLNSTEPMPDDVLMMVQGMSKNGDPNVMTLLQQLRDHVKKYGETSDVKLLGETQRSPEGWLMAKEGMFGSDAQDEAKKHFEDEKVKEADEKAKKQDAADAYAKAKAAQAPPQAFQQQNPWMQPPAPAQAFQQQNPWMQKPSFPQQTAFPQQPQWGQPQFQQQPQWGQPKIQQFQQPAGFPQKMQQFPQQMQQFPQAAAPLWGKPQVPYTQFPLSIEQQRTQAFEQAMNRR